MEIGQNGPPTDPKPLHRSKSNSTQFITFRGNSSRAKTHHQPIKGVRPTKGQHISFLLVIFFFFILFLAQRPAKTARPILTIYTSNDAVSRKEVPFGGTNACKKFQGGHFPPKHPKIGPPMGISSLNKTMNNFWTVHAISAHISSIGAAWRKKFETLNEITKNSF